MLITIVISIIVSIPSVSTFAQNGTETYENDEFGFAFEHPSNWKVEEPSPNVISLSGKPPIIEMKLPSTLEDDVSTRLNRPQVNVAVDSHSGPLEQYVSEQIDGIVSVTPNMNIESNETTIAGLPAQAITTTAGDAGKGLSVYTMTDDGTIYIIRYTSHPDKFDTYLPIAQKIMDSFRTIDDGSGEGGQSDIEQEDEEDENN